jgi:hypothetical protein
MVTSGAVSVADGVRTMINAMSRPPERARGAGVPKPTVENGKLANLTKDLYKGANTKNPIGTGSTADAIRHEAATGEAVGGKFHSQKWQEYARALESWLRKNPSASSSDRPPPRRCWMTCATHWGGDERI